MATRSLRRRMRQELRWWRRILPIKAELLLPHKLGKRIIFRYEET
jgi:hypothetical protein